MPRPRMSAQRWNVFPAKLCFDGKMLICNGRVWVDATEKLMKALAKERSRRRERTHD